MDHLASFLLFRVLPSVMAGAVLGYFVLRYVNRSTRGLGGPDARSSEISEYLNAAGEGDWPPNLGGSMGFPFMRRGRESLRIEPRGESLQVIRRRDDEVVARLEVEDPDIADHVFGLMAKKLEGDASNPADPAPDSSSPSESEAQEVLMQFRDGKRQLFLLRSHGRIKVADVQSGKLQGVAVVTTEAEGRELLAALSCKNAAQLEKHREQMKKIHAQPLVAGEEVGHSSEFSLQHFGSGFDDTSPDEEFGRRFS